MLLHRLKFRLGTMAVLMTVSLFHLRAKAQDAQTERTPGALTMGSSLGFAAAFPPVKNEPYSAKVITQHLDIGPNGEATLHEALNIHVRDSAGRLRDEQLATPPDKAGTSSEAEIHVIDPVSMQDIQWFPGSKTFLVGSIPAGAAYGGGIIDCAKPVAVPTAGHDQAEYESLGNTTIEGIRVRGCRITRALREKPDSIPETSVTEIWASPELQINLLVTENYSNGTERTTKLTDISRAEPDLALFQIPEGYTDVLKPRPQGVQNTNPNYAKLKDYGRIEWHGNSATLFAGNTRPLGLAALTLSTCLGISVSSEDPRYRYIGDLLDVTAPQWAAQHPDQHVYAPKLGTVEVTFNVDSQGLPTDLLQLLEDAAQQVNQQQPYAFRVYESDQGEHPFYSFIPTSSHNERGNLEAIPAYLDQKITIAPQTARIYEIASSMTRALSAETGQQFDCCQQMVFGTLWGEKSITYQATDMPARKVLEDLMRNTGTAESYKLWCEPLDKRFCFITVGRDERRKPQTAPKSGVCTAAGYDGN